ncbi:MAG: radical SAM family heme chaperone HemW [Planctomycetota bacterium]
MDAAARAGLYVHIPFCSAICPYCDFAVVTGRAERRERFVRALLREIEQLPVPAWRFDTIYFGGGTPSALSPEQLQRILDALDRALEFSAQPTVSFEANPEDVAEASAAAWQQLGIDTVSLGIQSFDNAELRLLGRRHDAERARASVELLRGRFRVISIDLIYGLPGQSIANWESNIETAAQLSPDHVSCYQLTVHEGTPFARLRDARRLEELPEEAQADHFLATHRLLPRHGLEPYEVSNFSRSPAHRSRHNQKYWDHTPYLGLGPSAHSFDGERRWWNLRALDEYQHAVDEGRAPVAGSEALSPQDLVLEALALRLRTTTGIELASFADRYGTDLRQSPHLEVIERWVSGGFAYPSAEVFALTPRGLAIADAVARSFSV